MIVWTPAVVSVLYACVLYFCICTCTAQLSMFHMERRSRNTLIIVNIIIARFLFLLLVVYLIAMRFVITVGYLSFLSSVCF